MVCTGRGGVREAFAAALDAVAVLDVVTALNAVAVEVYGDGSARYLNLIRRKTSTGKGSCDGWLSLVQRFKVK
jgi:hypothetical protein